MNDRSEVRTDTLATRLSLLERLKDLNDVKSWTEFLARYEQRVIGIARSRGLNDEDAEDVAQEVFRRVAASIHDYQPTERKGSFRSWLFRLTRWRASDQRREVARIPANRHPDYRGSSSDMERNTPTMERIPCPSSANTKVDDESRRHLIDSLLKRIERSIPPKQLQIFQMLTLDEIPPAKVAELYNMKPAALYVIKHRVMAKLREEIGNLRDSRF